jgi:beta-xylosidase
VSTALRPVYSEYFADPFVWQHEGVYYAVGTGEHEASGEIEGRSHVIPLLRSENLRDWEHVHFALVHPGAEHGEQFWAPAVTQGDDGMFYMYYSVGRYEWGINHHLRVAICDRPDGIYEDAGVELLRPNEEEVFVFDPHPYRDEDGRWYLFYNRNHLHEEHDEHGHARAGDTISCRPLETMTRLGTEPVQIMRPRFDWQRSPRKTDTEYPTVDWHTTEGACVVKRQDRFWCFYSGSAWHTDMYGVDYGVADHILGPYRPQILEGEESPRVLKAQPGVLRGPGHNSIVVGPDGQDFIVFHAWNEEMTKRQMHIEPIQWTDRGPRVRGGV